MSRTRPIGIQRFTKAGHSENLFCANTPLHCLKIVSPTEMVQNTEPVMQSIAKQNDRHITTISLGRIKLQHSGAFAQTRF